LKISFAPPKFSHQEISSSPTLKNTVTSAMQRVFGGVRLFYTRRNHTAGLTTLNIAREKGLLANRPNMILMNVDSHSDLYFQQKSNTIDSGNWVNTALLNHPEISEVIWVMPPEIAHSQLSHPSLERNSAVWAYCSQTPIFIGETENEIYFDKIPPEKTLASKHYRCIQLYMVTADKLPDLKNRHIYLSMDMDYFSNTGWDTYRQTEVPYQPARVQQLFNRLDKANIRPFLVNVAFSPEYSYTVYNKSILDWDDTKNQRQAYLGENVSLKTQCHALAKDIYNFCLKGMKNTKQ